MIAVASYKLGSFLAGFLPESIGETATELILRGQYVARRGSRRHVRDSVKHVAAYTGSKVDPDRVTRRVFSNFARSIYYFLRLPALDRDTLRSRTNYNGLEEELRAVLESSGVVLAGPHLGPWEIGGACIAALGLDVHTVALPHPSRRVTRFFEKQRARAGVRAVSADGGVNSLARALSERHCVALLVDRAYTVRSQRYSFFGRPVSLPVGHVALAVRCRVPVLMVVCVFDGPRGFQFFYSRPQYPRGDLDHKAAIHELQLRCIRDMEALISDNVEQWYPFEGF